MQAARPCLLRFLGFAACGVYPATVWLPPAGGRIACPPLPVPVHITQAWFTDNRHPILLRSQPPLGEDARESFLRIMQHTYFQELGDFMHKLVHNLALSMVLYHLMVGCCCHHAHADESGPHHDELAASCCSHHGHGHSGHGHSGHGPQSEGEPSDPADGSDREHGGCDDTRCVFVVPNAGGAIRLVGPVNPLALLGFAPQPTAAVFATSFSRETPQPAVALPLRLHLLNQILLI